MPDREKVIEGLKKVWDAFNHMEHELYADYVFDALCLLKEQPEIIRCKDCKWLLEHESGEMECEIKQGWFPVKPDLYCADGIRK